MNTTDNNIRVRLATDEDWPAVYQNQARIYGTSADTGDIEAWKRRVKLGDILVAEDVSDPEHPFLVGTSLYYRLRLTVPGGAGLDAAWLAMITVAATHQGRGIWQQISAQGFGILQERGYPILCGVPTQPPAYEIMGAGVASYCRKYHVDRDRRNCALRRAATGRARSPPTRPGICCPNSLTAGAPRPTAN